MEPSEPPIRNVRTAADLMEAGFALMRQNLRRRHPADSEAEIEARFRAWKFREEDPIPGDVSGPVRVRRPTP